MKKRIQKTKKTVKTVRRSTKQLVLYRQPEVKFKITRGDFYSRSANVLTHNEFIFAFGPTATSIQIAQGTARNERVGDSVRIEQITFSVKMLPIIDNDRDNSGYLACLEWMNSHDYVRIITICPKPKQEQLTSFVDLQAIGFPLNCFEEPSLYFLDRYNVVADKVFNKVKRASVSTIFGSSTFSAPVEHQIMEKDGLNCLPFTIDLPKGKTIDYNSANVPDMLHSMQYQVIMMTGNTSFLDTRLDNGTATHYFRNIYEIQYKWTDV